MVLPRSSGDYGYDEASVFPVEGQEFHIGNIQQADSQFHKMQSKGLDDDATVEGVWDQSPAAVRTLSLITFFLGHFLALSTAVDLLNFAKTEPACLDTLYS